MTASSEDAAAAAAAAIGCAARVLSEVGFEGQMGIWEGESESGSGLGGGGFGAEGDEETGDDGGDAAEASWKLMGLAGWLPRSCRPRLDRFPYRLWYGGVWTRARPGRDEPVSTGQMGNFARCRW